MELASSWLCCKRCLLQDVGKPNLVHWSWIEEVGVQDGSWFVFDRKNPLFKTCYWLLFLVARRGWVWFGAFHGRVLRYRTRAQATLVLDRFFGIWPSEVVRTNEVCWLPSKVGLCCCRVLLWQGNGAEQCARQRVSAVGHGLWLLAS